MYIRMYENMYMYIYACVCNACMYVCMCALHCTVHVSYCVDIFHIFSYDNSITAGLQMRCHYPENKY